MTSADMIEGSWARLPPKRVFQIIIRVVRLKVTSAWATYPTNTPFSALLQSPLCSGSHGNRLYVHVRCTIIENFPRWKIWGGRRTAEGVGTGNTVVCDPYNGHNINTHTHTHGRYSLWTSQEKHLWSPGEKSNSNKFETPLAASDNQFK